jgi:hypothetical protein
MKRFSVLLVSALILCTSLHGMNIVTDHARGMQESNPPSSDRLKTAKDIVPYLKQHIAQEKPDLSEPERIVLLIQLVTHMLENTHITAQPH